MEFDHKANIIFFHEFHQLFEWHHEQRLDILNNYMQAKKLPDSTIETVLDYFKYMWNTFKGVDEGDILQSLPEHLRKEALTFLEGETIRRAPIFRKMDSAFVRSIAMVLDPIVFCPGKLIYRIGEPASKFLSANNFRCISYFDILHIIDIAD